MKNLLHVTRNSLIVCALIVSSAHAKSVARIVSVEGNAFAVTKDVTFKVVEGDYVEDFVEILTEEGGQVSFVDFHDHTFHLSESGHIKIMNKIVELRSGKAWIQSKNRNEAFSIQTSNSDSSYKDSEFIVSYDDNKGKTQLMVINGDVDFSNILESHVKYTINAGQFSFVDQNYEDGLPRNPTKTGFKSFKTTMAFFQGVKPTDKGFMDVMETQLSEAPEGKIVQKQGSRKIASVGGIANPVKGKAIILTRDQKKKGAGKILFISSVKKKKKVGRLPASSKVSKGYFKKMSALKASEIKKSKRSRSTNKRVSGRKAVVRVFGVSDLEAVKLVFPKKTKVVNTKSSPINVKPVFNKPAVKRTPANKRDTASSQGYDQIMFERSLDSQYGNQKKHPEEVNELIDELQNYREDYTKQY